METQIPSLVTGVEPAPPADGQYGYQTDVLVTPEYAQYLIDRNADNQRYKKEGRIAGYSRDMAHGLWKDRTGETLKIDPDGRFIDGNNRMHAVVRANVPVIFDIAWNVPTDRMLVIDGGASRNTKDDFRITGVADKFVGGPLVKWAVSWERGNYLNHGGRLSPTRSEIRERYLLEPQAFDTAAMFGRATQGQLKVNASAAGLGYWLFAKLDEQLAEKFYDTLIGGIDMNGTSPIYPLRQGMIAKARTYTRTEQLYFFIRAWNGVRRGEQGSGSGRLQLPKTKLANETFPKPV